MTAPDWERVDAERGRTLVLRGEFDLAIADDLRDELRAVLSDERSPGYVDLSGVTFFDSTVMATLLWANRRAPNLGSELILVAPSRSCRLVLELAGVIDLFTIVDN